MNLRRACAIGGYLTRHFAGRLTVQLARHSTGHTGRCRDRKHLASRVAVLTNPHNPAGSISYAKVRAATEKLGVTLMRMEVRTPQEIDNAFLAMQRDMAGAVYVSLDALFEQQKDQIAQLALKHRLPCMSPDRMHADAGCLMSYGGSLEDLFRYAATYVDKIFKGRKPADLPVEQPTRIELFINGKTAKALGLKIPQALLISAEKVIE